MDRPYLQATHEWWEKRMKLPRLHCLTTDLPNCFHEEQSRAFCEGGARLVQMRSKQLSFTDHLREAEDVARVCREFGAVFIVNDSPEIALRGGADGVHLGKKDEQLTCLFGWRHVVI